MKDSIEIRTMTRGDLNTAVEWAAQEGWNPGLYDAECFYAADPKGFMMAWQDSCPIGAVSAVKYDDQFGFVGFFIVVPACRGHRVGLELATAAMNHLKTPVTGIDGVENKVKNYHSQYGFELAWNNIRYEGLVPAMLKRIDSSIRPAAMLPFASICRYDRRHFPASRDNFLKLWLTRPGTCSLAAVDSNGEITGLGVARACRVGVKIGPLFADNAVIAEALLSELLRTLPPGSKFYLDLPEPNTAALSLAGRYAMRPVFRTARMYRGRQPDISLDQIFGISSFELG